MPLATELQIAPLFNFSMTAEHFRLGSLDVRSLSPREKAAIEHAGRQLSFGLFAEASASEYGIIADRANVAEAEFDVCADRAIAAMRLQKAGAIYANMFCTMQSGGTGCSSVRSPLRPYPAGEAYVLHAADIPLLCELYEKLPDAEESKKGLGRAVHRFNLAYQRPQPEDRLIDFWIALEGLFFTEGNTGELRFRASLRIAHYVGASPEERWTVHKDMKRSYDLRSLVVHGERVDKREIEASAARTEEVLRRALRAVVLDSKSLDPQKLDRRAVQGVGRGN